MLGVVQFPVGGSCPEIPGNCVGRQLAVLEDVSDVFADGTNVLLEQVGHRLLRKPDGLAFHTDLQARASIFGLAEEEFARIAWHHVIRHGQKPAGTTRIEDTARLR